MEYNSAVWDPYTKKQTQLAAHCVCGEFTQGINYTDMEEVSMSDLVIQDGHQFDSDVNKVPAHPRSSQYKGHASTHLHVDVPHPEATVPIL